MKNQGNVTYMYIDLIIGCYCAFLSLLFFLCLSFLSVSLPLSTPCLSLSIYLSPSPLLTFCCYFSYSYTFFFKPSILYTPGLYLSFVSLPFCYLYIHVWYSIFQIFHLSLHSQFHFIYKSAPIIMTVSALLRNTSPPCDELL